MKFVKSVAVVFYDFPVFFTLGFCFFFLFFADNVWLISRDPHAFQMLGQTWIELLAVYGLRVALSEATWCTTAEVHELQWPISIDGVEISRSPPRDWLQGFRNQANL